jgi:hypothetical protein
MDNEDAIRELIAKLMQAVEASISTSSAVREALAELGRNGYEARLFFVANAESADEDEGGDDGGDSGEDGDQEEAPVAHEIGAAPEGGDLRFELTKLDHDFLKSLHIRPETG